VREERRELLHTPCVARYYIREISFSRTEIMEEASEGGWWSKGAKMKMELKLLSVVALHLLFHVSLALSELPLARGSNGQDLIEVLSQPAAWACVDSATVSWRCLSDSTAACSFR